MINKPSIKGMDVKTKKMNIIKKWFGNGNEKQEKTNNRDVFVVDFIPKISLKEKYENGKCGLIDETGKEVVPCIYDTISSFSDGFAKIRKAGKGWGIISTVGKEIVPTNYDYVEYFSNGEIYGYQHSDCTADVYSSSGILIKSFSTEEVCKKYGHDWDNGHIGSTYVDYRCRRCWESDKSERDF